MTYSQTIWVQNNYHFIPNINAWYQLIHWNQFQLKLTRFLPTKRIWALAYHNNTWMPCSQFPLSGTSGGLRFSGPGKIGPFPNTEKKFDDLFEKIRFVSPGGPSTAWGLAQLVLTFLSANPPLSRSFNYVGSLSFVEINRIPRQKKSLSIVMRFFVFFSRFHDFFSDISA